MSETPTTLAAALITLQGRLPRITKDSKAQVGTREYPYANLASIHDAVFPLLADCGLAWVCKPTLLDSGAFALAYSLTHAPSGEAEHGEYPLPVGATPQQTGSAITYARRYCLTAVLGIAPAEDDDDAQAAEQAPAWTPPANPSTRKAQRARGPLPDDEWNTADPEEPGSITAAQRSRMMAAYNKAGILDRQDRLAYAMAKLDLPSLASSNDLSMRQAGELIAHLESERDS